MLSRKSHGKLIRIDDRGDLASRIIASHFNVWPMKHLTKFLSTCSLSLLAACGAVGAPDAPATPRNAAPAVAAPNPDQSAMVGHDFSYDAAQANTTFSDADGDALSYSLSISPSDAGLTPAGGVISGAPTAAGTVRVTITATDSAGASASDEFAISVSIDQDAVLEAFSGKINLASLDNYAEPNAPAYITKLEETGNPVTNAAATLGRVLFYDVSLSTTDMMSCATCHKQDIAFGDSFDYSFGQLGEMERHTPRLINTQYADETNFFWNERVSTIEAQVTQPIHQANELGFSGTFGRPDIDDLIEKLEAIEYYNELFRFVFYDPEITEERLQIALGQFVKSIVSFDTRWDEGRAQVASQDNPFPNFTADENAGKTLFTRSVAQGGAGCAACHRPPEFDIDPDSGHNGVVTVLNDPFSFDFKNTRAPTLRDIVGGDESLKGPYMHDGQFATLRSVIDHYDDIKIPDEADPVEFMATLDARLQTGGSPQQLSLTEQEKDQLEAYLRTLGGAAVYADPKWSSPFPD